MPAPPWQACGWVRLSLGFREPSANPEKIPQEVTPNQKDRGPAWIYHRRGKTLSPRWWIRSLFPYHCVSEVPPRPFLRGEMTHFQQGCRLAGSFSLSLTKLTPISSCNTKEWKPLWLGLTWHKFTISAFSHRFCVLPMRDTPIYYAQLIWGISQPFKQKYF